MSDNSNTYNNEFNSLYNGTKSTDDNNKDDKDKENKNIFGDDHDNNNSHNDITPNILLEQLAYVDNFMPNINQDFKDLDTWILNDNNMANNISTTTNNTSNNGGIFDHSDGNTNNNNNNNNNNDMLQPPYILDEQLAAELSAFQDEVFIFPDEDKPKNLPNSDDDNDNNKDEDDFKIEDNNNLIQEQDDQKKKHSHYLSQRKNTFLTSQYDHSKSRFSSRRNKPPTINNNNTSPIENTENNNIEISSFTSEGNTPTTQNNNRSSSLRNSIDHHNPSVPSPLTLINSINESVSISSTPTLTTNNNNNNNTATNVTTPQIQMPDYSKISTESLVALLPRVTIPKSVNNMLIKSGFSKDQIIALSAIMAHYEQQKLSGNIKTNDNNTNNTELLSKLNQLNDNNPVKLSTMILVGLMDNIELENKIKSSSSLSSNNSNSKTTKPSSKDEILSLIEAGNKEVNELKNKLDKKIIRTQKLREEMNNMINENSNPIVPTSIATTNNNNNDNNSSRKRSFIETESDNQETEEISTDNNSSSIHSTSTVTTAPSATATTTQKVTTQRKKLKEKELESTIQELRSLASSLESKIDTLQLENRLLKDLVVNSGEQEGIEKAENIKQNLLKKFNKD